MNYQLCFLGNKFILFHLIYPAEYFKEIFHFDSALTITWFDVKELSIEFADGLFKAIKQNLLVIIYIMLYKLVPVVLFVLLYTRWFYLLSLWMESSSVTIQMNLSIEQTRMSF